MKAKAPDKIYVDSKAIGDDISTTVHTKRQDYPTCTEYTRTDAFIEKAEKWLERNFNMPNDFECHFRKAMEK